MGTNLIENIKKISPTELHSWAILTRQFQPLMRICVDLVSVKCYHLERKKILGILLSHVDCAYFVQLFFFSFQYIDRK